MNKKEDFTYDYIRYEDEDGNKIPERKVNRLVYNNKPVFKCWVVGGKIFQLEKLS